MDSQEREKAGWQHASRPSYGSGGGAENRTPVHDNPLGAFSKLSQQQNLEAHAADDSRVCFQLVRSYPGPYQPRAPEQFPEWRLAGGGNIHLVDVAAFN